MLYALICEDKPDSEALRKSTRDDHLEFLKDYDVRFAGPMLGDDETAMVGSIIVVDLPDRDAVEHFAALDPYGRAGLFARVTIRAFRKVIPA